MKMQPFYYYLFYYNYYEKTWRLYKLFSLLVQVFRMLLFAILLGQRSVWCQYFGEQSGDGRHGHAEKQHQEEYPVSTHKIISVVVIENVVRYFENQRKIPSGGRGKHKPPIQVEYSFAKCTPFPPWLYHTEPPSPLKSTLLVSVAFGMITS